MEEIEIVDDLPPNYWDITEAIPEVHNWIRRGVVFAWSGTIYAPGSHGVLPVYVVEHEKFHFLQQDGEPAAWWQRYLADPQFRLEQEIEAHAVEHAVYCRQERDRNRRAQHLAGCARRLSGPLYGRLGSFSDIMRAIKKGSP